MNKAIHKKSLIGILIFCVAAMATNMTMGILAKIMQSYPDVSPVTVQSVLVGPALIGTIYAFFVGMLNRKIPAKRLLMFAQAALLLYGIIFWMGGGKVPIAVLICASGLAGFNQGSMNTIFGLLLMEAVPDDKKRGSLIGIGTAVMSIGGVVFTTVGGIIANVKWQNAYLLFFYYLIAIILELILLPNVAPEGSAAAPAAEKQQDTSKGGMARVWILSIHYFFFFLWLYCFGTNCSEYVISTYKLGTAAEAGIAASCVTIGGIFAGLLYGAYSKVLKRFTVPCMMGLSVIGLAIAVFITDSLIGVYVAGILLGFAMMGANPYILEYLQELAPGAKYGKALSVFSGFMNAGMVVAIYVIAFLTQLVCGNGVDVHYKFVVAFVGDLIVFALSFFVYLPRSKKADKQ